MPTTNLRNSVKRSYGTQAMVDDVQTSLDGMHLLERFHLAGEFKRKKTAPHCDCYSVDKANPGKYLLEPIPTTVDKDGCCTKCGHHAVWL